MEMKKTILLAICLAVPLLLSAQQPDSVRMADIAAKLRAVAETDPSYDKEVDISVGKLQLSELLRNVARAGEVNLSVRNVESIPVSCNFTKAKVSDVVMFLCREYDLDIDVLGNIVAIRPVTVVPQLKPELDISYDAADTTLSYDLTSERLIDVAKRINTVSGRNVIAPQSLYEYKISGYVRKMPFDSAMRTLADVNGLGMEKDADGVWSLYHDDMKSDGKSASRQFIRRRQFTDNELRVDSLSRITAHISRGSVQDIILDVCDQMNLNYYFDTPVNLTTGVYVENTDFETLLGVLLKNTPYTYYKERGIYVFGSAEKNRLTAARVIPMEYRSVNKVADIIPAVLRKDLQIQTFADLNSLIVGGDQRDVFRVETFLKSIDKPVPLISIEIIIADVQKNDIKEAGIEMGLGKKKTSATLSPGLDVTLGSSSVNNLISRFNGLGSMNLGKVAPDFYLSLQFLEENGTIKLYSTPKLSTLNGHEASLSSGETQYYKEVQNNYYGTQNPIQSEAYTWKSVDANLDIKVTPYVSKDKHITMEIEITQTEFTAREEKNAPPGTATRSFKSIVKVCNEEMVLLGGIDRNSREKTSRGLPFIARVPVLKWLFGKHKNNKIERRLNIFIKPTVIE